MAWSLVTSKEESRSAFDGARQSFGRDASLFSDHSIGWQGGSHRLDVRWHPHLGIWGVFEPKAPLEKNPGRFWICFGVDDPAERAMLHITVETNPPIEGINRRVGGAFLRDHSAGQLWLAHTGKVGGGRPGIGLAGFRKFYSANSSVYLPERRAELFLLSPVNATDFAERLSPYVQAVARFKAAVTQSTGA